MRSAVTKSFAPILVLALISAAALALSLPNAGPPLRPHPGTGMFLMLSDIHFDPYADPAIIEQLGAQPAEACRVPTPTALSKFGSDTNFPLLKSTLEQAAAAAAENHFRYDYVIATGDFLAHNFDARYQQCVGGDAAAYGKFASDTLRFVHAAITKALPGVPVFAALGNNDTDRGDYGVPSAAFLERAANDWGIGQGTRPDAQSSAVASFKTAGYYSLPHPFVPNHELMVLNSSLYAARNSQACSDADADPGRQFAWLNGQLTRVAGARGKATLIMHILPGIDAMRSSLGAPRALWNPPCTQKLMNVVSRFPRVVSGMYAGHIHRDDFRIFPSSDGRPLCAIHVVPAVSPVYLDNPAFEIGWYDKANGELKDYATLALDLGNPRPTWKTEYIFTQAYGSGPDLAALLKLSGAIRAGNPTSGVGKMYATFYAAGVNIFFTPANWLNYACAQTEFTLSGFDRCRGAADHPRP